MYIGNVSVFRNLRQSSLILARSAIQFHRHINSTITQPAKKSFYNVSPFDETHKDEMVSRVSVSKHHGVSLQIFPHLDLCRNIKLTITIRRHIYFRHIMKHVVVRLLYLLTIKLRFIWLRFLHTTGNKFKDPKWCISA